MKAPLKPWIIRKGCIGPVTVITLANPIVAFVDRVCGNREQLGHCLPDNIVAYRPAQVAGFKSAE